MKTRLLILVISGIVLFSVIFFSVSQNSYNNLVFDYDEIEYDDLITRDVSLAVYKTVENHPEQNCFILLPEDLKNFPGEFFDDLNWATEEPFREDPQIYPPGVYSGYAMSVKKDLALELVKKYERPGPWPSGPARTPRGPRRTSTTRPGASPIAALPPHR